jgi:hypothetical protein
MPEKDDGYKSLRKAMYEAVGLEFSAEAVAAAAKAVVADARHRETDNGRE